MFGWFKSEVRRRRKKIKLDRKHLEERTRRFLKSYLDAHVMRKPQFYRTVEDASKHCQQAAGELPPPSEQEDAKIAEATSEAAMNMVLEREKRVSKINNRVADFVTDAYATVGIAYHRAAGLYATDNEMQKLGTAAVHLLTMASSYVGAEENEGLNRRVIPGNPSASLDERAEMLLPTTVRSRPTFLKNEKS